MYPSTHRKRGRSQDSMLAPICVAATWIAMCLTSAQAVIETEWSRVARPFSPESSQLLTPSQHRRPVPTRPHAEHTGHFKFRRPRLMTSRETGRRSPTARRTRRPASLRHGRDRPGQRGRLHRHDPAHDTEPPRVTRPGSPPPRPARSPRSAPGRPPSESRRPQPRSAPPAQGYATPGSAPRSPSAPAARRARAARA